MKVIRVIILLLIMAAPLAGFAQSSIDSAVAALEKSKSVINEVFSERRDPATREVIRSNRVFSFNDDKVASKIMEAMRKERSKAVGFQMNTAKGQEIYTISFETRGGLFSKYTLVRQGSAKSWVLSIEKTKRRVPSAAKDRSDAQWHQELEIFGPDSVAADFIEIYG